MKKILLLSLAWVIASCGSSERSQINDSQSPIKIYVSKVENNVRVLAVSSTESVDRAEICQLEPGTTNCVSNTNRSLVDAEPESGKKTMYATEFPANPHGTYLIKMGNSTRQVEFGAQTFSGSGWKSIFLSGDYVDNGQAVVAWDNARRDLSKLLMKRGFAQTQMQHLSRDPQQINLKQADGDASLAGINTAFDNLNVGQNDACFLFMTSHGTKQSFYIEGGSGITPAQFAKVLDEKCGNRPTVAIVSACYAGIMINEATKKDNRIIFTAASAVRTSNGCQAGIKYTWFDECLVSSLEDSNVKTWSQLGTKTKACINSKENASNASDPQFFIGNSVQNLGIGDSINL